MEKQVAVWPDADLETLADALESLPAAFGDPHAHAGMGLRKLMANLFEFRVGLKWRVLFRREQRRLVAFFAGNHDDMRRYLKGR